MRKSIVTMVAGVALAVMSAFSTASVIAFDEGASIQGGTLHYDGLGGALFGSNIDFTTSIGVDTAANQGPGGSLACVSCLLNFETGANIQEGPGLWTWASGGAISLTGTLMDGLTQIATGTLLDGMFSGTPGAVGGGGSILFAGIGEIDLASSISAYFGEGGSGFSFATTELALGSCEQSRPTARSFLVPTGGFNCNLHNADLALTAAAVPNPGTLALFGAGLIGLSRLVKRKRK